MPKNRTQRPSSQRNLSKSKAEILGQGLAGAVWVYNLHLLKCLLYHQDPTLR